MMLPHLCATCGADTRGGEEGQGEKEEQETTQIQYDQRRSRWKKKQHNTIFKGRQMAKHLLASEENYSHSCCLLAG